MELSEVLEYLKRIEGRIDALGATVQRTDEAIRGNGKPGLRQEMSDLRGSLRACQDRRDLLEKERVDRDTQEARWWTRFIQPGISMVYLALSTLLILGFVAWIGRATELNVKEQVKAAIAEEIQGDQ